MRNYYFVLLVSLSVSSVSFGQKIEVKVRTDPENVDTVSIEKIFNETGHTDSVSVDSVYKDYDMIDIDYAFFGLNASYSHLKQANAYFALNQGFYFKHIGFETSMLNLSVINYNGSNYYSSNSLATLVVALPFGLCHAMSGNDPSFALLTVPLVVIVIPAVIEGVTNFKIGYQLNKNLKILAGLRTDYYYFYPVSRTSRQWLAGTRLTFGKFNIDAYLNHPWTTGYITDNKSFISMSLGYDFLKHSFEEENKRSKNKK